MSLIREFLSEAERLGATVKAESMSEHNVAVTFFCFLNMCVGSGMLALPFVVYHAGLVYGVLILLLVALFTTPTVLWTLEAFARAQVCTVGAIGSPSIYGCCLYWTDVSNPRSLVFPDLRTRWKSGRRSGSKMIRPILDVISIYRSASYRQNSDDH